MYAALRDCEQALTLDSSSSKAAYRQARCLFEMEWFPEAEACLKRFMTCFPDECNTKLVKGLERDIKAALFSQTEGKYEENFLAKTLLFACEIVPCFVVLLCLSTDTFTGRVLSKLYLLALLTYCFF